MDSRRHLSPPSPARVAEAKKTRAKHACRECNSRRVKCDVTEKQPCSNCANTGGTCEVLPSRRGRYPRRSRRVHLQNQNAGEADVMLPLAAHSSGEAPVSAVLETPRHVSTSEEPVDDHAPGHFPTPAAAPAATVAPPPPPPPPEPTSKLFFGESSPLALVSGPNGRTTGSATVSNERRPLLDFSFNDPSQPNAFLKPDAPGISPATMHYLRDEGALLVPDLQSCLPVIAAYFNWSHPCYPILDRAEVTRALASMELSLLLFHCILFVGSMYCDDDVIAAMGFEDRWLAKTTFYTRARLLFSAGWEKDVITQIQSIFLLSFWRGGPAEVRDVRYWLGIAGTVAECYGLHRSARSTDNIHMTRLRRRIWWSVYVREQQTAAALGLPARIRYEDCDVEPLSPLDFESELASDSPFGTFTNENVVYSIKMVEISRLLGKILGSHFAPGQSPPTADELRELNKCLQDWKDGLPDEMRHLSEDGDDTVWACAMHLSYNYLRLLIHRHAFLQNQENEDSEVVVRSASQICRITIDMSTRGTLRYAPVLVMWSIFSALCIQTLSIRRSTGVPRRIAEHRAEMCLLGLKELQKYWFMKHRLLDIFIQQLDRSTAARLVRTAETEGGDGVGVATLEAAMTAGMAEQPDMSGGTAMCRDELVGEEFGNVLNGGLEAGDPFGDLGLFLRPDDLFSSGEWRFL